MVRKNVRDNVIYVSHGYDTKLQYGRTIHIQEMHWITEDPFREPETEIAVSFKTRHTPEFSDGTLERGSDGNHTLHSATDIQGIAPGQYAIIYTPDRKICLGSGMIAYHKN